MIDIVALLPEITLAVGAMALLMLGVFARREGMTAIVWISVLLLVVTIVIVISVSGIGHTTADGLFVIDGFATFVKVLVLGASALTLLMSVDYFREQRIERFEYPVLVVTATLGMLVMVSANDLMTLYIGLELQSLSLYVVAAMNRDSVRSTEAGLKYFVLGALSSGLLLYGCSLVYGFTGSTSFTTIADSFAASGGSVPSIGFTVGLVFVAAGLAFKVSAVPFHMWTPDVYEGAPTPVTAFFAAAPKVAAIALFLRVLLEPFGDLAGEWQQIVILMSIASMVLGAFAAIGQSNIKRLMAYSSIGHVGYALIGFAAGGEGGVASVLVYMSIYLVMNIGAFACILSMRTDNGWVERIEDFAGLAQSKPRLALAFAVALFSLAGIPPLAGFFGKLYIFMAAIDAGLVTLAVIGVLASVVGAYYYLRIIKIMYFDDPAVELEGEISRSLRAITAITAIVTLFFFILPAPLISAATSAAATLFTP